MTTHIDTAIRTFYATHGIQNETILVGVSGGVDSTVLVHALLHAGSSCGVRICIAHINHCLRGDHSDNDERFVRELAEKYNCQVLVDRIETREHDRASELGIEACARMLRYESFARWAEQTKARFVCTAHTMHDNVETFIMHAARGSGYKGLSGIPALRTGPREYSVARPLLDCSRSDVEHYAMHHGLTWRHDHSNDSFEYTRNRVRHSVLPAITSALGPAALSGIHETSKHMKQLRRGLDILLAPYRSMVQRIHAHGVERIVLDADALNALQPDLRMIILHDALQITSTDADRIQTLLTQEPGARATLSNSVMALKERGFVVIGAQSHHDTVAIDIEDVGRYEASGSTLDVDYALDSQEMAFSTNLACFDADTVHFPLTWRTWTDGDRITPFGMDGKSALVSDILSNLHVPNEIRRDVRVLTDGSSILWVCGHRRSNIAPVTHATTRVLRCTISTHEHPFVDTYRNG